MPGSECARRPLLSSAAVDRCCRPLLIVAVVDVRYPPPPPPSGLVTRSIPDAVGMMKPLARALCKLAFCATAVCCLLPVWIHFRGADTLVLVQISDGVGAREGRVVIREKSRTTSASAKATSLSDDRPTGSGRRAAEEKAAIASAKTDGMYAVRQHVAGKVFTDGSTVGPELLRDELSAEIVWSLVKSFSPAVNQHVQDMFQDEYGECAFFAIIPAIVRRRQEVLLAQRIWLAQFEHRKRELRSKQLSMDGMTKNWKNTWQENYLYHMRMNDNYEAVEPGELIGIPTTTNIMYTYKSDGPMDPRWVQVGEELLLIFHTWLNDKHGNDEVGGRVHLWHWDKKYKRKLVVPGLKLRRTEINWIPMDVNGSLHLTYSLDPLRVMKCTISTGNCVFVHQHPEAENHTFTHTGDRLRGGTPFIMYKYPYYIGVGHSVSTSYRPREGFSVYSVHFIVMTVDPWRLVYVSRHIEADQVLLRSRPLIRNHTIIGNFWYPMGIVKWSDDIIDVSCHVNDYDGHVVRLRGIEKLMKQVIEKDQSNVAKGLTTAIGPHPRALQQYVLEALKERTPSYQYMTDYILHTPD